MAKRQFCLRPKLPFCLSCSGERLGTAAIHEFFRLSRQQADEPPSCFTYIYASAHCGEDARAPRVAVILPCLATACGRRDAEPASESLGFISGVPLKVVRTKE